MQIIPLTAVPSQYFNVTLANQNVSLSIYTLTTGLFIDVLIDNVNIITAGLCLNKCLIVRDSYHGLEGDLAFIDQQGSSDPDYTGLGDRYILAYLTAAEAGATGW